jgi:hypothetical protein
VVEGELMGYANIIDANLTLVFNQLKDLAKTVTLRKKSSVSFDFASSQLEEGETSDVVTKAVFIEDKKSSSKHNSTRREILFKSRGVGDLTMYDAVLYNGETWKLGPVISNNGYTVFAEIYKEG